MHQIGYLGVSSPSMEPHYVEAFRQKLRDLGHVEGKNIAIEYRWAEGQDDRLPNLATELVRLNPDAIVTTGTPGAVAAIQATKTIPIVMATAADPVGSGLVASLARPGGNVTGFTILGPELEGKRLELLKQAVPGTLAPRRSLESEQSGHRPLFRDGKECGPSFADIVGPCGGGSPIR